MSNSESQNIPADWGSGHFILEEEEGELQIRLIVGFMLGPSEIDDRYVIDFYFQRKNLKQKDKLSDEIKFHLNFKNWSEVVYWVHEVPLRVSQLVFVTNEWGMEYLATDPKIFDRVAFLVQYIESQLPDVHAHIYMLRENSDLSKHVIEKSKLH
ncbi:MAG: hypothetical protein Q8R36_04565 [bacterium]|nr:hypothetical protein [bacterium]